MSPIPFRVVVACRDAAVGAGFVGGRGGAPAAAALSSSSSPPAKKSPLSVAAKTKPKQRRRRGPQRPGKTAKDKERLFVKHDYHDLSLEPDDPAEVGGYLSSYASDPCHAATTVPPPPLMSDSFPMKLHRILDEADPLGEAHIISWQPHGRAFRICDPTLFTERIMPRYFPKMKKITSLQRQFNLYGFERLTRNGPDAGAYYHESFLRGRPGLSARRMVRRRVKGTGYKAASNPEAEPDLYALPSMDKVARKLGVGCGAGGGVLSNPAADGAPAFEPNRTNPYSPDAAGRFPSSSYVTDGTTTDSTGASYSSGGEESSSLGRNLESPAAADPARQDHCPPLSAMLDPDAGVLRCLLVNHPTSLVAPPLAPFVRHGAASSAPSQNAAPNTLSAASRSFCGGGEDPSPLPDRRGIAAPAMSDDSGIGRCPHQAFDHHHPAADRSGATTTIMGCSFDSSCIDGFFSPPPSGGDGERPVATSPMRDSMSAPSSLLQDFYSNLDITPLSLSSSRRGGGGGGPGGIVAASPSSPSEDHTVLQDFVALWEGTATMMP